MQEQNNIWTQLFQDSPISADMLNRLQQNVMAQILSCPADFDRERRMAERRRWGAVLGISIILVMVPLSLLFWFQGEWLIGILMKEGQWIGNLLPLSWQIGLGHLRSGLDAVQGVIGGIRFFWQQLSLPVIGFLCLIILDRRSWEKDDRRLM